MNSCEEESIGRQIYICGQAMRKYADQKLKKHDLTVEQLHILKQLSPADGRTQSQLCELVGKSPANMTRILDRLEKKRRIGRRNNPDDRRSTLVLLTGEGEALLAEVELLFGGLTPEVVAGVTPEERRTALKVLKKILHNVSNR
ncbi:MAG: MarR family transcriptional regulator [Deltaproteobacteria bacterium]|nr:MarR family transcriptional regulator [Deltaproteobacteria bacterium]